MLFDYLEVFRRQLTEKVSQVLITKYFAHALFILRLIDRLDNGGLGEWKELYLPTGEVPASRAALQLWSLLGCLARAH